MVLVLSQASWGRLGRRVGGNSMDITTPWFTYSKKKQVPKIADPAPAGPMELPAADTTGKNLQTPAQAPSLFDRLQKVQAGLRPTPEPPAGASLTGRIGAGVDQAMQPTAMPMAPKANFPSVGGAPGGVDGEA